MYRLVVLTDTEDGHGFRLAGVDVVEANTPDEARRSLNALINDDTTGVIAINEDFMETIDSRTKEKIDKIYRPIVVPIPTIKKMETMVERREYLASLIRRAVGFDIKLRAE